MCSCGFLATTTSLIVKAPQFMHPFYHGMNLPVASISSTLNFYPWHDFVNVRYHQLGLVSPQWFQCHCLFHFSPFAICIGAAHCVLDLCFFDDDLDSLLSVCFSGTKTFYFVKHPISFLPSCLSDCMSLSYWLGNCFMHYGSKFLSDVSYKCIFHSLSCTCNSMEGDFLMNVLIFKQIHI